ncbi:MAG: DUF3536 domain-containing protein [Planctomycetota bacterium]|jgi:alpha-amylase/alpha-mannosidase (GH57 family)
MEKYICIHGHFYQPPRENPWLEDVELQDGAYPYHDWNEKITDECYSQNAASRILDRDKKIVDIVNNYSRISFNFGPTLLSWLEKHALDIYESIIEADTRSLEYFSGHGAAIAQAYNHVIMPLANARDKRTQVIWGLRDFEQRFARKAEGMWLPETAVDNKTLQALAEEDIKFTILCPHQARRMRKIGSEQWEDVNPDSLDTRQPYLCTLADGRTISLFFYNKTSAQDVADGRLLKSGENFARQLAGLFSQDHHDAQLAHIATDGETYGHHHRHTDMALAYCLDYIESNKIAEITVYGEFLEKFPPTYEVQIHENTSWSCEHGIERWRSNCGCHYGRFSSGAQQWRAPLREAMDRLSDQLAPIYEAGMNRYVAEPWETRNKYISVINDRSIENIESFLANSAERELSFNEKADALKLLEMQRNAMLMYTSCGWFFDDICGIETVQVMLYASRAIQLAKEVANKDFEPSFEDILEQAPTNVRQFANAKEAYEALVKPGAIDLNRVAAHLAISSIFEEYPEEINIYCYTARIREYDRFESGIQLLVTGRATIQSDILLEEYPVDFAVLHFGDHNLTGAVNARMPDNAFYKIKQSLEDAFAKGDATEVMRIMNLSFEGNSYSLWDLFKDEQQHILNKLLEPTWKEIETSFRHVYEHNYTIMQMMRRMNIPLPRAFAAPAEFIFNKDLGRLLQDDQTHPEWLQVLADEADKLSLHLDETTLQFESNRKINRLMTKLADSPYDVNLLEMSSDTVTILQGLNSDLDLRRAQNILFAIKINRYGAIAEKAESGEPEAQKIIECFQRLADRLKVAL